MCENGTGHEEARGSTLVGDSAQSAATPFQNFLSVSSVDVPYGYLWDMKAREVSAVNSDTVSEHAPSTPRFVHAPTVS